MGDAIPITANNGSEECVRRPVKVSHIPVDIIKPKHYVGDPAVTIGRLEGNHDPAVGRDSSFIGAVAQCENLYRSSIRHLSKGLARHFRLSLHRH